VALFYTLRMRNIATADSGATRFESQFESHRRELTGYCYRMLGSGFEAEDAVQETMVRAWRGFDRFEGRSTVRSWLYRIATNVCLDMLRGPQRRARPMDLGPSSTAGSSLGAPVGEHSWVLPVADARVLPSAGDPADVAALRDSIRLAFVATLQLLPPRQRAVLILREVLCWQAEEVAELLESSVASVNSALQRARATMALSVESPPTPVALDAGREALIAQYVDAFERYDVARLVSMLRDDVVMSMPPFPLWLEGPDQVGEFFLGQGRECAGSRLLPVDANGSVAFGAYHAMGDGHARSAWAIQIIETDGQQITGHHNFLSMLRPDLFASFGLPDNLDD
jgi:RNA polymerase sigma-70 factor (ECF subfamily)